MMAESSTVAPLLPIAVRIGFSGSRHLLPTNSTCNQTQREMFHQLIEQRLIQVFAELPVKLGLQPHHFLCGISQIAVGGDTLFTRACAAQPIPQQIFLPQTRDEFLAAVGSSGKNDFSPEEKSVATDLLKSPHIIEQRVVSHSHTRSDRFEEANLEILRTSNVCVCLLRVDAGSKAGGAKSFLTDARMFGLPALEVRVGEKDGVPIFEEEWYPSATWQPPALPSELNETQFPSKATTPSPGVPLNVSEYLNAIKSVGSHLAKWQQTTFRSLALIVIVAHFLATVCAVLALALDHASAAVAWLLGFELAFLLTGFWVHHRLHSSRTVRVWASSRLTAEIARSVGALHDIHANLAHLFMLPFPASFRALLDTTNVLHLASHKHSPLDWTDKRQNYLAKRFDAPATGQLCYYTTKLADAKSYLKWAAFIFNAATVVAFIFTATKFALHGYEHAEHSQVEERLPTVLGSFAILLPVVAVGALSLSASFDLVARAHTYQDTLTYLNDIRPKIEAARSESAFLHLVMQVESRLLGETANWFSRRSFTGVT